MQEPNRPPDPEAPRGRQPRPIAPTIDWAVSPSPVGYLEAVQLMERRALAIAEGRAPELVWLLEHPPIYTAGTSARPEELLAADRFPVFPTGRGGKFTYHGPGQRIVYVMLDVKRHSHDVRAFVRALEAWIIAALAELGIVGETRDGRVGIWVPRPDKGAQIEDKIAAIGLRLKRWVSFHGVSLNVRPELEHFSGIVPCGISGHGVTSLADLGRPTETEVVDNVLRAAFEARFGPTRLRPDPLKAPPLPAGTPQKEAPGPSRGPGTQP